MELRERVEKQLEEALGPVNRWYCSRHYGHHVNDPNILLAYYIKHGGAENFARMCQFICTETLWLMVVHGVYPNCRN